MSSFNITNILTQAKYTIRVVFNCSTKYADLYEVDNKEAQVVSDIGDDNIDETHRGEYWHEHQEQVIAENRDRSLSNKRTIMQIDIRTAWIARLLLGLIVTVLGGYITTLL